MKELLGGYEKAVVAAEELLVQYGIESSELVQCDALCYRVETNERYDELNRQLGEVALLIDETEISGRNITLFELAEPLKAGRQDSITYIEVPQPKQGSEYSEGIDHVKFVTRRGLAQFRARYSEIAFDEKGLVNKLNPLLRLHGDGIGIKFHDKHMGAVAELERNFTHGGEK